MEGRSYYELLIAALHASCHSFYYPNIVESLTECRATYQLKYLWVNEIYEGGIEETAKGDRNDRIY
jgi:hypothetical protein